MRVRQNALGHRHRQERNAGLLNQLTDLVVDLRVGRALAQDDQGTLGALENVERALDGGRRGNLLRRGVDHLDERLVALFRGHDLREELRRQIEIDAAGTARARGANGARDADADILRMEHAERSLAERLGDRELIHFFVVALLQVDDLTLGGAGDQDHRETVGGGVGQRGQAIEEARSRNGKADAGLLGQVSGDRGGVAGDLLVAERDDTNALALRHAAEVRNRNSRHGINRVDIVQLERVNDEMEAIRQFLLRVNALCYCY